MRTEPPAAPQRFAFKPSQNAGVAHSLRMQMALSEAERLGRGERIKQLREESAYTQPALADLTGVTLRAYQRWEEGGGIAWEHLEKLAEIHDVDVQWLHRGANNGTPDVLGGISERLDAMDETLEKLASVVARLAGDESAARGARGRKRKRSEQGEDGPAAP